MNDSPRSLVADVGGTNTRVALARDGHVVADTTLRYRNADHSGLGEIFGRFLDDKGGEAACEGACIAMAGPVLDGEGKLTNLDWRFDRDELADVTGAGTTAILNDLQAQGHALGDLQPGSVLPVRMGPDGNENNAELVIGIGTGFNAVPVFRTATGRYVPPCEAGHTTLPVLTDDDVSLARFVTRHHGFPGVEDVLSGRGLQRVYDWALDRVPDSDTSSSAEIMALMADGDPVAERAGRAFVQAMGRVAGDLALIHLPFGGIFFVGGMANAMHPYLEPYGFWEAFSAKGRFEGFMGNFSVSCVDDDYAALTGCARHLDGLIKSIR